MTSTTRAPDRRIASASSLTRRTGIRLEGHSTDRRPGDRRDLRFALDPASVGELGPQTHVLGGRRVDPASDTEDLAAALDRLRKVLLEPAERRQDQVAEAVATHLVATIEPVAEERREDGIAVGEREQAIPDVSGRQHAVRLSEPPRAPTVVGH